MAPVEGSQRYSQPACNHLSKKLGNYDELIDDYLVGEDLKMTVTSFLHCSIDGVEYFGTFPQRRFRSSSGTIALSDINVSFKLSLATPTHSRHRTSQTRSLFVMLFLLLVFCFVVGCCCCLFCGCLFSGLSVMLLFCSFGGCCGCLIL